MDDEQETKEETEEEKPTDATENTDDGETA